MDTFKSGEKCDDKEMFKKKDYVFLMPLISSLEPQFSVNVVDLAFSSVYYYYYNYYFIYLCHVGKAK